MLRLNWAPLSRPAFHVQEPEAPPIPYPQILSALLLAILAFQTVESWLSRLVAREPSRLFGNDGLFLVALLTVTLFSYYSCRCLNYKLTSRVVVILLSISIIVAAYPDTSLTELNLFTYYLLPILISFFFLSIQTAIIVTLVGISSMIGISYLVPASAATSILLSQGQFMLLISVLLILVMFHRYRLEAARRLKLVASEQQLRLITNNIQEGICLTDIDGVIRYVSPSFRAQANLTADTNISIYDKVIAERLHPDDVAALHIAFRSAIGAQLPTQLELRVQTEQGSYRWMESNVRLLLDNRQQPHGAILVWRDVHDRRQAEEALAAERNLLRTLIDNLPDQIYAKDQDGKFVLSNAAHNHRLGVACEQEVLGKTDFDLYPQELAERYYGNDRDVIVHGKTISELEEPSLTVDAAPATVLTTKAPLYDKSHNIIGLVGSTHDITQRKQMEQQLREAEKLHVTLEKEKELSELRNQFMSTISHEFRTPLATILSSSELLERYESRLTSERKLECLKTIQMQVSHLTALLQDFAMIIRVQNDRITFEPQPVNVQLLCEEIVAELRTTCEPDRPVQLSTEGMLEEVGADKRLLRYILVNLLGNAVKYSPLASPISLNVTREGSQMVFAVSDQGIGICPEDYARLFDPFFRGRNVGNINGTGLGLKIVKDCVDIYDGSITVESNNGVGTRFIVRLPTAITEPT